MFTINYKLSERLLREQRNGNSKNDKNLDRTLETMNSCLTYVRNALMYIHKTTNLANAELFKFANYEERMEMIVGLFLETVSILNNTHIFT
jgi:hypothetical protein